MEQEKRRPASAFAQVDFDFAGVDPDLGEAFEHGSVAWICVGAGKRMSQGGGGRQMDVGARKACGRHKGRFGARKQGRSRKPLGDALNAYHILFQKCQAGNAGPE
jgi:hypothetical protein